MVVATMRKFIVALAMTGLLLGITSSAQAGVFVPQSSTLSQQIFGLPPIPIQVFPGTESLVSLNDGGYLGWVTGRNVLA